MCTWMYIAAYNYCTCPSPSTYICHGCKHCLATAILALCAADAVFVAFDLLLYFCLLQELDPTKAKQRHDEEDEEKSYLLCSRHLYYIYARSHHMVGRKMV